MLLIFKGGLQTRGKQSFTSVCISFSSNKSYKVDPVNIFLHSLHPLLFIQELNVFSFSMYYK